MENIEWTDIITFLENNKNVPKEYKEDLSDIFIEKFDELNITINDLDFDIDDAIDILNSSYISSCDEKDILNAIGHECEDKYNELYEKTNGFIQLKTLEDVQKFEIIEKIFDYLTYDQLLKIEQIYNLKNK